MAVGRHFDNSFIAISQPEIIQFQRNLVCSRKLRFQGLSHDKVLQFCKFSMADGRHNENRFSSISGRYIFWLTRNFVRGSIITLRHRLCDQNIPAVNIWTDRRWQNSKYKCKKLVYLQLITAKWHIENSKNNERWYYFTSTSPVSTCF